MAEQAPAPTTWTRQVAEAPAQEDEPEDENEAAYAAILGSPMRAVQRQGAHANCNLKIHASPTIPLTSSATHARPACARQQGLP